MNKQEVLIFFYGSYINLNVLKEVNYTPRKIDVAKLTGYKISIRPLANIEMSDNVVYGILATGTHDELNRLYNHAETVLGGRYLPRAVLVQKITGEWIPAITYVSTTLTDCQADNDYVERIANPAEEMDSPNWYVKKLRTFKK